MPTIAFLITTKYQIYHYAAIARHLPPATFVIEVRDRDFDLDEEFVRAHVPSAHVQFAPVQSISQIDGQFDVIVCQTSVLPEQFLRKSLIVAQQYSLAKETYQYGIWRSMAHLNLMYGQYSVERVSGFCNAVAAGNPMFDRWFDEPRRPARRSESARRGLYVPTYGSLSSIPEVAPHLEALDCEMTVKLHHSEDPALAAMLPDNCVVVGAEADPLELYETADFVISDMSGAAYDALYARRPLVLVGETRRGDADFHRLSSADVSRELLDPLAARWTPGQPLNDSIEQARILLDEGTALERFTDQLFTNHGTAGQACATAILDLLENGEPQRFDHQQVRDRTTEIMRRNREVLADNRRLARANDRLRSRAERRAARAGDSLMRRVRPVLARSPRVERTAVRAGWAVRRSRQQLRVRVRDRSSTSAHPSAEVAPNDEYSPVPAERREQVAALVHKALVEAGLSSQWDRSTLRPVCPVLAGDKPLVLRALNSLAGSGIEVRAFFGGRLTSTQRAGDLMLRHIFDAQTLRVGIPLTYRDFTLIDDGCIDIVFATALTEKQRVIGLDPRHARVDWTAELGERAGLASDASMDGVRYPSNLITEVDVVYTWVDSSDPSWRESHARHSGSLAQGETLASANNAERFMDREELRYSLRSLWHYAPFVRNVYVVTADQRPRWLNELDERVTVVSHSEIFPDAAALPTFNSHAIEACLHRIPGLSEYFIYMNDDVFFGREVDVNDFFTRTGQLRLRFAPTQYIYDGTPTNDAIPTDWAAFNAKRLIGRDFGVAVDRRLQHVAHPLRRSILEEIETRYSAEVRSTQHARFRSRDDLAIPSMFAPYYAEVTNRGVGSPLPQKDYVYADTGRSDWEARFALILRYGPAFFCLNTTKYDDVDLETQAENISTFLDGRYPFPSPFEQR